MVSTGFLPLLFLDDCERFPRVFWHVRDTEYVIDVTILSDRVQFAVWPPVVFQGVWFIDNVYCFLLKVGFMEDKSKVQIVSFNDSPLVASVSWVGGFPLYKVEKDSFVFREHDEEVAVDVIIVFPVCGRDFYKACPVFAV